MVGKNGQRDLGFDLEASRDALMQYMIERGARPATLPDLGRPLDWSQAMHLANVYAGRRLPGERPKRSGRTPEHLMTGAARALSELVVYPFDVNTLRLCEALETSAEVLSDLNERTFGPVARELIASVKQVSLDELNGIFYRHAVVAALAALLEQAQRQMEWTAAEFRTRLVSTQGRGSHRARGPAPQHLLTAVWQHMYLAGFEAHEVCTLVPDQLSAPGSAEMIRRVRTRAKAKCMKLQFQ